MRDVRRVVARIVIAAFSLAALMGIVALLAGDFGSTGGQVLGTTFLVGVECLTILCYLTVAETRLRWLGVIGFLVSLVPFGFWLLVIWGSDSFDGGWRVHGVTLTLALTIAQACLVWGLTRATTGARGAILAGTLAAMTIVAAMTINAILVDGDVGEAYWRIFGVVAILDALGSITLIALRVFGDRDDRPTTISPAVAHEIARAARERGMSADELVSVALARYLGSGDDAGHGQPRVDR